MKETIAPVTDAPWWRTFQAQVEAEVRLTPGMLPVKDWLFKAEAKFERAYRGYRCFWPRASLRVLGVFIGGALFVRGGAIVPQADCPKQALAPCEVKEKD
jgi:hypothetical protein